MSKLLIVGVDVSKGYADFIVIDDNKNVVAQHFRLDDNKAGHIALTNLLKELGKTYHVKRILLITESTGGLEDNWLRLVKSPPLANLVEGFRINPKITHHEYRAQRRSSVSDRVSSLTIAEHVAKNLDQFEPREVVVNEHFAPARSLVRHIVTLQEEATVYKNGFQQLLYQYLPSLVPMVPNSWANYFLEVFIQYGSKKSIQKAAAQGFKRLSRVPNGKAEAIYQALLNGIDPKETPPLVVAMLKSKARKIQGIKEEVKELEKLLVQTAPVDSNQVQLLCSIKGMGKTTATVLLCFIEDADRFESGSSIAAFFGVQPRLKSSGDGLVKVGMSKQGSGLVRRELYLLAFRVLSNEPYLKSIYAKHRQRGKNHDEALGVIMHKLIRIIYGMLKNGTTYDSGIDQLNQVQPRNGQEKDPVAKQEQSTIRRYQTEVKSAPVSKRKQKERKKDQESQAAELTESTGSS